MERAFRLSYVLFSTFRTLDEINKISGPVGGCRKHSVHLASDCAGERCLFSEKFTSLAMRMGALVIALISFLRRLD